MMNCEEVTDQITDYLEGRVPYGKKMGMWLHLMMCVRCRTYLGQIRQVVDLLGVVSNQTPEPVPGDFRETFLKAARQQKSEDAPDLGTDSSEDESD
ncbi:MAG: anti-sigma factor family protein [Bradymonadaceae bacterium]